MEPKPQRQQQPKPQHRGLPEPQELVEEFEALRYRERNRSERLAELVLSLSQTERSDVVIDLQRQIANYNEELKTLRDRISYLEKLFTGQDGNPPIPPIPPEQKQEEYEQQLHILQIYRDTLVHLLKQAAKYGGITYAPPHVAHGIHDARQEVAQIKRIIHGLGYSVNDNSIDSDQVEASSKRVQPSTEQKPANSPEASSKQVQPSTEKEPTKSPSDGKVGCAGFASLIFAGVTVYMFHLFLDISFWIGTAIYIVSFICISAIFSYIAEQPNKK